MRSRTTKKSQRLRTRLWRSKNRGARSTASTILFPILTGAHTNPVLQKTESEMAPKLAAHLDAILLNPRLFARVQALYDRRAQLGLDAESSYLLERYYKDFVRAGAKLSEPERKSSRR